MLEDYTDTELDSQQIKIEREILRHVTPVPSPLADLIVGQPGAGKSMMADILANRMNGNVAFLSGDDYRKFHPRFSELLETHGDDAVLYTQHFAGEMTERLIDSLSQKKLPLIIEGTLRTTAVPLKTKHLLECREYAVALDAILVRPEISYLSTVKRYFRMKEIGAVPRMTPKEHHDKVVAHIIENLNTLYQQKAFQEIRIFNRAGECLYDLLKTPDENPAMLFQHEFSRKLTAEERSTIHSNYNAYLSNIEITKVLSSYEKIPFSLNSLQR